ncbi:GGDEF domain-containing response regulator [Litchfieldia salsa]|uniref:Diguanylate cyclase (GGDEF) domain-containing protein n=1 Tax=Litchfieldia salsa TaxID=930152 RepID=A0A1H0RLK0_9BACI|nr:diguanylate cyclase [Litchfieldia salsa]SDP30374.1 diguanylate cyclase (GGDEF) domain-containing protein [Litchfieldia salsa]
MKKYKKKFMETNKAKLDSWFQKDQDVDHIELYRFLHSIAGTAPTIGLDNLGAAARNIMNEIEDSIGKRYTISEIQELLFSFISYFNLVVDEEKDIVEQILEDNITLNNDESVVMIIDDDTSMLMYLKEELQKQGWYVVAIADPLKAVSTYYDVHPDCLIIDVFMKEHNGFEVLTFLKQKMKQQFVPTIMMSVKNQKDIRLKSYEMGADEFVAKPFELDELIVKINRHLERKKHIDNLLLIDELTRVYNRKYLQKAFQQLEADLSRNNHPFCMAMLDLDYFKKINDTYGHLVGDNVLKQFATFMNDHSRNGDLVVRFGGEEFVLLFSQMKINNAYNVLNRLLHKFSLLEFTGGEDSFICTFSGGIVEVNQAGKPLSHWLDLADSALYEAKEHGRKNIKLANDTVTVPHRKKIKVAIVDDDPIIRTMLNDLFNKVSVNSGLDMEISVFRDGQVFLANEEYLQTNSSYLVVLDGIMPKMDGLEVLQRLRAFERSDRFTVLMLTSRNSERDISRALQLGADDYITKPFKILELESRIHHLLKRVK